MRIAVLSYPGVSRACYRQLISAALRLSNSPRMQQMARWSWTRFSGWLHALPFEMDTGSKAGVRTATKCTPPQRMREFPPTMNCWERVLHQLAWFAARGAARATIYDHDTLVGRHIEVLVPTATNLSGVANGPAEQARDGALAGLQGGLQGGMVGSVAGPYGAFAGFLIGAGTAVAKSVMSGEGKDPAPQPEEAGSTDARPSADGVRSATQPSPKATIETLIKTTLQRPQAAKTTRKKRKGTR